MPTPLLRLLEEARDLGFLGPGPIEPHIGHALRLLPVLPNAGQVLDLGSGGGLPSLPLAVERRDLTWILVDAHQRRCQFLEDAVGRLGLVSASVRCERAEVTGRSGLRATIDMVVARSFGPPGVTAELAAPLLRPDGVLWVAEPPEPDPTRWPEPGVRELGLELLPGDVRSWQGLRRVAPCPERYPRRVGIPTKRPIF